MSTIPEPGTTPGEHLRHTLAAYLDCPDDGLAIMATSRIGDGPSVRTGLTWGDLRAIHAQVGDAEKVAVEERLRIVNYIREHAQTFTRGDNPSLGVALAAIVNEVADRINMFADRPEVRREDPDTVRAELAKTGHGHVVRRTDGTVYRCGGPELCHTCKEDQARLNAAEGR